MVTYCHKWITKQNSAHTYKYYYYIVLVKEVKKNSNNVESITMFIGLKLIRPICSLR